MPRLIICWLFLLPTLIFAQTYQRVQLPLSALQSLPLLDADHPRKVSGDAFEVVLSAAGVTRARDLGFPLKIVEADLAAAFRKAGPVPKQFNYCGLDHLTSGSIGGYHSYAEAVADVFRMQELFPGLVSVAEAGRTHEDRPIYVVKLSDNAAEDESATEGTAYFDAMTHAREPLTLESLLYFMWSLLEGYGQDAEATYLLDHRELWFVPVVNPDGVVYNETTAPNGGGLWRKNRRTENNGSCDGVDLNRNFSTDFANPDGASPNPCDETYHGLAPFSEPETATVRSLLDRIRPAIALNCHSSGDFIIIPPNADTSRNGPAAFTAFAARATPETYVGYGDDQGLLGYSAAGTADMYFTSTGALGLTPEIGDQFWIAPERICSTVQETAPMLYEAAWSAGGRLEMQGYAQTGGGSFTVRLRNVGKGPTPADSRFTVEGLSDAFPVGSLPPGGFWEGTVDGLPTDEDTQTVLSLQQGGATLAETPVALTAGFPRVLFTESGTSGLPDWRTDWFADSSVFTSPTAGISDSPKGSYERGLTNKLILRKELDFSEVTDGWLEFTARWSLENIYDYVRVFARSDRQANFWEIAAYNGTTSWNRQRLSLARWNGDEGVQVSFELTADQAVQTDGFYLDDLRVVHYTAEDPVSTVDAASRAEPTVFPNPVRAEESFEVRLPGRFGGRVVSAAGREVLRFRGRETTRITAALPTGVYFLLLDTENERFIRKLVVR